MTSPRRIAAAERGHMALELRKAGVTYEEIAKRVGYNSKGRCYDAIMRLLRKTAQEPADEVRRLEINRLDALWLRAYTQVQKGDLGAIDRCLRIMERRARLLGLDAPLRHELTGEDGQPFLVRVVYDEEITLLPIPLVLKAIEAGR